MGLPPREFEFTLPKGWLDGAGNVHQTGVMRLATARDELIMQRDRRCQDNPIYGDLVMLSRVIVQLGNVADPTPEQLENLFTQDLNYLRAFYNQVNQQESAHVPTQCPQCQHQFDVELALSGES
ncbi:MAG: phage tail assembly protein [Cyanobacteria bacterium P01_A01_bin.123]